MRALVRWESDRPLAHLPPPPSRRPPEAGPQLQLQTQLMQGGSGRKICLGDSHQVQAAQLLTQALLEALPVLGKDGPVKHGRRGALKDTRGPFNSSSWLILSSFLLHKYTAGLYIGSTPHSAVAPPRAHHHPTSGTSSATRCPQSRPAGRPFHQHL